MAYIGIGYSGSDPSFLRGEVDKRLSWLRGERRPHFFGDGFVVLYDSNTAREFVRKCADDAGQGNITLYPMDNPLPQEPV
ncbi:MAG TPA: hypothetical protein VKF42_10995 [Chitinivibrionales bacterium]|jgi:hypothetical protein|nr:hypothetical protein [Chitinivibrionales bacterium]